MSYYSYVVARDYGFAPNPFYGYCTLATCKPRIRKGAKIGDWIFGNGSSALKYKDRLIFAMKITDKMSFDEYWNHQLFQIKKPRMNGGTLKNLYGDNIYHRKNGDWIQADSHHSLADGKTNHHNLDRDTGTTDSVLISEEFFYFGKNAVTVPDMYIDNVFHSGRNHSRPDNVWGDKFVSFLKEKYRLGLHADPIQFDKFKRYKGEK